MDLGGSVGSGSWPVLLLACWLIWRQVRLTP